MLDQTPFQGVRDLHHHHMEEVVAIEEEGAPHVMVVTEMTVTEEVAMTDTVEEVTLQEATTLQEVDMVAEDTMMDILVAVVVDTVDTHVVDMVGMMMATVEEMEDTHQEVE